ncbi:chemotaxis protein CheW [Acetivibrio clariflavus]|uniref:Chemotaxis signal transduction protein n=1 Tax=Acetivibrio clariflavus (strain DSM 19732 / NBRC 101661 / EBR45) TaxID=720554 RepID=G8M1I6_ACECE|nr:chemotaxis protein CheW [Acetivibrio clariflavus]AEV69201.1 chemotaxis signal transduction protein [Acetivibrio clariflavus DSM 19732]HPU42449.1 chemotaxis protein CheW [Acetivibrio clariflavus]
MEGIQIVVFTLNDEMCGVETTQVKEIVKYESITKMPDMPKFIDGVISLRGTVVPVVNLNKRFGLGETEITKKTKIIINDIEGKLIGFIVNDVSEIIKIPAEDIENTPDLIKGTHNAYLKNVGKKGDQLISILDLSAILTDTEIKSLDVKN